MRAACLARVGLILFVLLTPIIFSMDWINVAQGMDSGGQLFGEYSGSINFGAFLD